MPSVVGDGDLGSDEVVGMSESGLFVGWGQPVRGREKRSLDVFNDAATYYGERVADGVDRELRAGPAQSPRG